MKLIGSTGSHVGNVREANQDRVFFGGLIAALADGMGGHQGGERAAELAIAEFEISGDMLTEGELVEVVMEANRQVHDHAAEHGLPGMGTTLVALALHDDETITVANVGDSRAYWLRGDYMGQVTEDHSFVEDLVRQGRLKPEEAAIHPQRNILTRAVGIGSEVEVDRFPIPEPMIGDRFLLCSDGLFNELPEEQILEILLDAGDVNTTAKSLIEAALETPCRDNVTVAVVDVVEDDDPALDGQSSRLTTTKPITAPVPVVSKSRLHEPGASPTAGSEEVDNGGGTGTLLLEEGEEPTEDPELFLDTTELEVVEAPPRETPEPRRARGALAMGVLTFVLISTLILGGLFLAMTIARNGFHVVQESDDLVIYEGRRDGFLGFDPVRLDDAVFEDIGQLTDTESALIEQSVDSRQEAEALIADLLRAREAAADDAASSSSASSEPNEPAADDAEGEQGNLPSSAEDTGDAGDSGGTEDSLGLRPSTGS
ncbi:MAG: protein phosphatase 2C domain-containing protein [Actinomycetota bacterium]